MKTRLYILLTIIIAIGLTGLSCEGPAGPEAFDETLVETGDFNLDQAARQTTLECTKQHPCNRLSLGFDPAISGVTLSGIPDPNEWLPVLKEYTQVEALVQKQSSQVVFVYGIGHGEDLYGPFVSNEVVMVPGDPALVGRGEGPIDSPWEAFDDPLVGFVDPLVGFVDPLLGFDDPLLGFGRPLNGVWGNGNVGFDDPLVGLNAVWGNGNVTLDPDAYGLVLFSMSVGKGGASVLHNASIVPFHVTE